MSNDNDVWTTDTSANLQVMNNNSKNNGNTINNNENNRTAGHIDGSASATSNPMRNFSANGQKNDEKNTEMFFGHNNPFLVGVQSKFRRKYYHKTINAVLILIILILLIAVIIVSVRVARYSSDICETPECLRAASNLILSMDRSADPCENFYQFTCGNWHEEHPRPDTVASYDWFTDKQNKVMRTIREFLRSNQSAADPQAVNKTKTMYRACMDVPAMNQLGIKPLIKYLKAFKLPLIPRLFNVTTSEASSSQAENSFNWLESLALIKATLQMDIIIGFDILTDPFDRNTSIIAVGTPEITSPLPFTDDQIRKRRLQRQLFNDILESDYFFGAEQGASVEESGSNEQKDEDHDDKMNKPKVVAYIAYIRKVLEVFIKELEPDFNVDPVKASWNAEILNHLHLVEQLDELQKEAENITTSPSMNPEEDFLYLNIKEVENMTNDLIEPETFPIYDQYIPLLFEKFSDTVQLNQSRKVITSPSDIFYLKRVKQILKEEVTMEKLEFFIWWAVVDELLVHTSDAMRHLHNEMTRALIKTELSMARSIYCTKGVNSLMGMAVSYTLARDDFYNNTLPKVSEMLHNIRTAFNNLVRSTLWMDDQTKEKTLEKSKNMKSLIGFPDWIMNSTRLDEYYEDVMVNETTHLENMIDVLRLQMKGTMMEYDNKTDLTWASAPSNVNAFHTFQANTITIPIAILQYPFYDLGLEALNYGAIGAIIGHELTHGFDDSGRMFDASGNLRQWWTNRTTREYINRTECFVKQYGSYYLKDADGYIDGKLTLGENIADNGGLREAYYAYKILSERRGREKRLPGLDSYTHEQLLFISFGNLWCETATPDATKFALEDTHCPGHIRLKGVLTNSHEFAETFNCPIGSNMNPTEKRCRIW